MSAVNESLSRSVSPSEWGYGSVGLTIALGLPFVEKLLIGKEGSHWASVHDDLRTIAMLQRRLAPLRDLERMHLVLRSQIFSSRVGSSATCALNFGLCCFLLVVINSSRSTTFVELLAYCLV